MIDMPAGGMGDIPFASMGDLGLDRRKVTQCALSRICGVCGESLARPVAFLGSVEEADRNAFHFPPSHIECVGDGPGAVVEGLERGPGLSRPRRRRGQW